MVKGADVKDLQQVVAGYIAGAGQRVLVDAHAMAHMGRHRQLTAWATEAGGQLFGTINESLVSIKIATGPYRGDERSRYRYRSNPKAAQQAIDDQAKQGLLYLGEWHTHAEDRPGPSGMDDEAMGLLIKRSHLNSNALFMMIIGRVLSADGLGLWSVTADMVLRWQLEYIAA